MRVGIISTGAWNELLRATPRARARAESTPSCGGSGGRPTRPSPSTASPGRPSARARTARARARASCAARMRVACELACARFGVSGDVKRLALRRQARFVHDLHDYATGTICARFVHDCARFVHDLCTIFVHDICARCLCTMRVVHSPLRLCPPRPSPASPATASRPASPTVDIYAGPYTCIIYPMYVASHCFKARIANG